MIGTNFNFVPEYNSNNKLIYKKNWPQLFENLSYFNEQNLISVWNEVFFRKSLNKFIKYEFQKISDFTTKLLLIEENISLAKKQLNSTNFTYKIHSPNPKYVLSFLLAKIGAKNEAHTLLKDFLNETPKYNIEVLRKLEEI